MAKKEMLPVEINDEIYYLTEDLAVRMENAVGYHGMSLTSIALNNLFVLLCRKAPNQAKAASSLCKNSNFAAKILNEVMSSQGPVACQISSATSHKYSATNHTSCDTDVELSNNEKTPKIWMAGETDSLFALRLETDGLFKKSKIHTQIWNSIAAEMEKQGYSVSGSQCSNKWKSLKRSYMETVNHISKTGESPKIYKYFGEMNQLFGNKPSTQPTFTVHSSGQSSSTPDQSVCKDKDVENTIMESDSSDSKVAANPARKKKNAGRQKRKANSLLDFLKEHSEGQINEMRSHEQFQREQQDQRLARSDLLLDILPTKKSSVE